MTDQKMENLRMDFDRGLEALLAGGVVKDALNPIDPCVHCGESTAFGYGKFVNRLGWDAGWSCAECASLDCDICDEKITLDEDRRWSESLFACHEECLTEDQNTIYELWFEHDSHDYPERWFTQVMESLRGEKF